MPQTVYFGWICIVSIISYHLSQSGTIFMVPKQRSQSPHLPAQSYEAMDSPANESLQAWQRWGKHWTLKHLKGITMKCSPDMYLPYLCFNYPVVPAAKGLFAATSVKAELHTAKARTKKMAWKIDLCTSVPNRAFFLCPLSNFKNFVK